MGELSGEVCPRDAVGSPSGRHCWIWTGPVKVTRERKGPPLAYGGGVSTAAQRFPYPGGLLPPRIQYGACTLYQTAGWLKRREEQLPSLHRVLGLFHAIGTDFLGEHCYPSGQCSNRCPSQHSVPLTGQGRSAAYACGQERPRALGSASVGFHQSSKTAGLEKHANPAVRYLAKSNRPSRWLLDRRRALGGGLLLPPPRELCRLWLPSERAGDRLGWLESTGEPGCDTPSPSFPCDPPAAPTGPAAQVASTSYCSGADMEGAVWPFCCPPTPAPFRELSGAGTVPGGRGLSTLPPAVPTVGSGAVSAADGSGKLSPSPSCER